MDDKWISKAADPTLTCGEASPCVMVIDDEPDFCTVVSELLGIADVRVHQAHNAGEAIRLLEQATPNLILTDVMMPGMDGLDFVRHVAPTPTSAPSHDCGQCPRPPGRSRGCAAGRGRRLPGEALHLARAAAHHRPVPCSLTRNLLKDVLSTSPPDPLSADGTRVRHEPWRRGGTRSGGWGEPSSPHPQEYPPLPLRDSCESRMSAHAGGGARGEGWTMTRRSSAAC